MLACRRRASRPRRGQPTTVDPEWADLGTPEAKPESAPNCRLPLLLSLVVHGVLVLGFWCATDQTRISWENDPGTGIAPGPEMDFSCILLEPDPPQPRLIPIVPPAVPVVDPPTPAPPVVANASTVAPTVDSRTDRAGEPGALAPGGSATGLALPPGANAPGSPNESIGSPNECTGPPARSGTTEFFQVPAQGRSVVYVIDRSGSMGLEGRLAAARRELLASLERLPPTARFQVIVYNRFAEPLRVAGRTELMDATPKSKSEVARLLEALVAEGNTEYAPALRRALALGADVIYFLTDADGLRLEEVQAITQLNRGRCAIHAIELTTTNRDRAYMPMHILAQANRGVYRAVDVTSEPLATDEHR